MAIGTLSAIVNQPGFQFYWGAPKDSLYGRFPKLRETTRTKRWFGLDGAL